MADYIQCFFQFFLGMTEYKRPICGTLKTIGLYDGGDWKGLNERIQGNLEGVPNLLRCNVQIIEKEETEGELNYEKICEVLEDTQIIYEGSLTDE